MSYIPGSLYDEQKKIEAALNRALTSTNCKKILDMKEAALVKPQIQKNVLAGVMEDLVGVLDMTQNVLKTVSTKVEELQSELIANQKSVIKPEERAKRKELVANLKEKIQMEPGFRNVPLHSEEKNSA
jgi:hydroxymethylglutaryl-CoA reductase